MRALILAAVAALSAALSVGAAHAAEPQQKKFGPDARCWIPADDPSLPKSNIPPMEPDERAVMACRDMTADQLTRAKLVPPPTKAEIQETLKRQAHLDAPGVELTDDLLTCISYSTLLSELLIAKPTSLPAESAVRGCSFLPFGKKVEVIGHGQTEFTVLLQTEDGKKLWTFAGWLKLATE
jgi:hypothetical protein